MISTSVPSALPAAFSGLPRNEKPFRRELVATRQPIDSSFVMRVPLEENFAKQKVFPEGRAEKRNLKLPL
jgi:hypothetical protein